MCDNILLYLPFLFCENEMIVSETDNSLILVYYKNTIQNIVNNNSLKYFSYRYLHIKILMNGILFDES